MQKLAAIRDLVGLYPGMQGRRLKWIALSQNIRRANNREGLYLHVKGGTALMIETLLSNPAMAIVVVLVAIVLAKILKISMKVIKWIILIGIAYVIVNALHIF